MVIADDKMKHTGSLPRPAGGAADDGLDDEAVIGGNRGDDDDDDLGLSGDWPLPVPSPGP